MIRSTAVFKAAYCVLTLQKGVPAWRALSAVLCDTISKSLSELSISESSLEGTGSFKVPNVSGSSNRSEVFVRCCEVLWHSAGYIAIMTVGQDEIGICALFESIEILYDTIDFNNTFSVYYCSRRGVQTTQTFEFSAHASTYRRIQIHPSNDCSVTKQRQRHTYHTPVPSWSLLSEYQRYTHCYFD